MFKLICCVFLLDICNYIFFLKLYCLCFCSCLEDENNKLLVFFLEMFGGGMDS